MLLRKRNDGQNDPLVPGFLHVHPPYYYRCPFGKSYGSCNIECASNIENTVIHEGAESVAAIIVEPVILGGGVIVPPDEYLPLLRDICDRYDILLILDEVISGFALSLWCQRFTRQRSVPEYCY